jgi:exportin-1
MHATLLRHMIHVVEAGQVQVPLFDPAAYPAGTTNSAFVRDYIAEMLLGAFPNLGKPQVQIAD